MSREPPGGPLKRPDSGPGPTIFQAFCRFFTGSVRRVTGRSYTACDSIRYLATDALSILCFRSVGRLPETLCMDEEDGRPGPGAWQSGPADVLADASVKSLHHLHSRHSKSSPRAGHWTNLPSSRSTSKHQYQGETQ